MSDRVTVRCPSSPNLLVAELHVQFVDGVAEVTPEQAEGLAGYRVHGVILPGDEPDEPTPEPEPEPEKPARKTAARRSSTGKPFG